MNNMLSGTTSGILAALIFSSCFPNVALASGTRGFIEPIARTDVSLGKSKDATGEVHLICSNYKTWAIVQLNDPALMGAKELEFRYIGDPNISVDLCARNFKGKVCKIDYSEGYFAGADQNFAIFDAADSFGALIDFTVYDVKSAKEIFKATRFTYDGLQIIHGKTTSLKFTRALEVNCPLVKEGPACWDKIVAANKLPKDLHFVVPDCRQAFRKEKASFDSSPQLGTNVVVDDLENPKIRYLGGAVYCAAAP